MIAPSLPPDSPPSPAAGLSNRVFLLALAGILFLTLFPFRFAFADKLPGHSPFLLGTGEKADTPLDVFLNILLFIPLGFGLSEKLRHKGWTWKQVILATWIAGAFISYTIELLQIYIPTRDSGWEDILTNSTGAVLGSVFFAICGRPIVEHILKAGRLLRSSLTLSRTVVILLFYFGIWFSVSAVLQKDSSLDEWNSESRLYLAGDPQSGPGSGWQGRLTELKMWNVALSDAAARTLTASDVSSPAPQSPLVAYDFAAANPNQNQSGLLPDFSWSPRPPALSQISGLVFDGRSWLTSKAAISPAIQEFKQTNQFSLLVACTPATPSSEQRIVSVAQPSGPTDLLLRQDGTALVFWFRNSLSVGHAQLAWNIPGVFAAGQPRRILMSYDGSHLTLYVDGHLDPRVYILGPGARLAEQIRRIKPAELEGYAYLYDALIFLPAGALLGTVITRIRDRKLLSYLALAVLFLAPPWAYAQILSHSSGGPVSLGTAALCLVVAIAASFWINADRPKAPETN